MRGRAGSGIDDLPDQGQHARVLAEQGAAADEDLGGRAPNVYSQQGEGNSTQPEQQRRLARPVGTERG